MTAGASGGHDVAYDRLADLIASAPHNLVSRRERATVRDVHVPECLAVGQLLDPAPGDRWMDLGTGGGLPGLVLAVAWPEVEWTLIDATAKKVELVRGFARTLGLHNVRALAGRAEVLARREALRGCYDGVVSRALARLVVAAELSRGFVRPGATVAAVKGPRWREELDQARPVLADLRLRYVSTTPLPTAARATCLVTMRADGPPPAAFPRRDGVPRSQPLGSDCA